MDKKMVPLTYENPFEKALSGLDIKDWIWHHTHTNTKYTTLAKTMGEFFNLDNKKIYMLTLCDGNPIATEVSEKGKKYEIPCDD